MRRGDSPKALATYLFSCFEEYPTDVRYNTAFKKMCVTYLNRCLTLSREGVVLDAVFAEAPESFLRWKENLNFKFFLHIGYQLIAKDATWVRMLKLEPGKVDEFSNKFKSLLRWRALIKSPTLRYDQFSLLIMRQVFEESCSLEPAFEDDYSAGLSFAETLFNRVYNQIRKQKGITQKNLFYIYYDALNDLSSFFSIEDAYELEQSILALKKIIEEKQSSDFQDMRILATHLQTILDTLQQMDGVAEEHFLDRMSKELCDTEDIWGDPIEEAAAAAPTSPVRAEGTSASPLGLLTPDDKKADTFPRMGSRAQGGPDASPLRAMRSMPNLDDFADTVAHEAGPAPDATPPTEVQTDFVRRAAAGAGHPSPEEGRRATQRRHPTGISYRIDSQKAAWTVADARLFLEYLSRSRMRLTVDDPKFDKIKANLLLRQAEVDANTAAAGQNHEEGFSWLKLVLNIFFLILFLGPIVVLVGLSKGLLSFTLPFAMPYCIAAAAVVSTGAATGLIALNKGLRNAIVTFFKGVAALFCCCCLWRRKRPAAAANHDEQQALPAEADEAAVAAGDVGAAPVELAPDPAAVAEGGHDERIGAPIQPDSEHNPAAAAGPAADDDPFTVIDKDTIHWEINGTLMKRRATIEALNLELGGRRESVRGSQSSVDDLLTSGNTSSGSASGPASGSNSDAEPGSPAAADAASGISPSKSSSNLFPLPRNTPDTLKRCASCPTLLHRV